MGNTIPYILIIMMISSIIMVFTKSIIPKLIGLLGFIAFFLSNQNPKYRFQVDF